MLLTVFCWPGRETWQEIPFLIRSVAGFQLSPSPLCVAQETSWHKTVIDSFLVQKAKADRERKRIEEESDASVIGQLEICQSVDLFQSCLNSTQTDIPLE